jgi:actin-related protein 3
MSPDMPEFFLHKRHVFIMTLAGRPIFVRYGDEIKSAIFLATLNAIF